MITPRPDSAAKAIGYLAVAGGAGIGVYSIIVQVWVHFAPVPVPVVPVVVPPAPVHVQAPAHTRAYYKAHRDEMFARLQWCDDHPGTAMRDDDCQAASAASW